MPRQLPKPTKEESKLATELQAPPKRSKTAASSPSETTFIPKMRTLSDAGLDGGSRNFLKMAQLFPDDNSEVSEPFMMVNARLRPYTPKPGTFQVDFSIRVKDDDNEYIVSMSAGRMVNGQWIEDDQRMRFVSYFQTNTIPLGLLELHKHEPARKGQNGYVSIEQCPEDVIPF